MTKQVCFIRMVSGGLDTSDVSDKSALKELASSEMSGINQTRDCEDVNANESSKVLTPSQFSTLMSNLLTSSSMENAEIVALQCIAAYNLLYSRGKD